MTVYVTSAAPGYSAILASSLDVRIIAVELAMPSDFFNGYFYLAPSGSISGGSTQVPQAAKVGAPAAVTTARVGSGVTVTGTKRVVGAWAMSGGGTTGTIAATVWKPDADLILQSGSVFECYAGVSASVIYFEELRLSWGY